MPHDQPILQCPNYFCQALNPEGQRCCQRCQTALPKRYLWAVGVGLEAHQAGDLIGDRYLLKSDRILFDTKPGMPADVPSEITPSIEPYLRLFTQRSQMPQVYGMVQAGEVRLLLLDHAAVHPSSGLMPALLQAWDQASPIRQLNWLWQIAKLWQPMKQEKVSATLLNPDLIRVDSGIVRILELEFDQQPATLADLGQQWAEWKPHSALNGFYQQLCDHLIQGQFQASDQLVTVLENALAAQSPTQSRRIQIATATDQGPSRQTNEDACYPTPGQPAKREHPLVIVCDGIGGHEGGEVASGLAIDTILQQPIDSADLKTLPYVLEDAVLAANTVISERNDLEQRQERQRMGTTVVMGYVRDYALYLTHVGDSRAYRITRSGCSQVTLDDDVASRDVRLGYTLYREALQHPSAGSLVQALGMGSSSYLHPTVQNFVLDEDCVYLLCSDGLSDNDRIEEYWETDIAPILTGKLDLPTAARKLVEIANTKNGHDNVTIGLIYCQVSDRKGTTAKMPTTLLQASAATQVVTPPTSEPRPAPSTIQTQISNPASTWKSALLPLLGVLGVAAVLALLFVPEFIRQFQANQSTPSPAPAAAPAASPSPSAFTTNSFVQIRPVDAAKLTPVLSLLETTEVSTGKTLGRIPPGSILQVQAIAPPNPETQGNWVQFKVCKLPKEVNVTEAVGAGVIGWQREPAIAPLLTQNLSLKPDQLGACATSTASPSP